MSPNAKGKLYDRFVGTLSPGCVGLIGADAGAWNVSIPGGRYVTAKMKSQNRIGVPGCACFVGAPHILFPFRGSRGWFAQPFFSWMYS